MLVPLVVALALALPIVYIFRELLLHSPSQPGTEAVDTSEKKMSTGTSIMQPPSAALAPPKDDPFSREQLKEFDGSDASKPIYVSIKGTVFDVTRKADTYGKGKSYNLFAGRDASKALGKSSLKEEDAIPDYSGLDESEMKTLNDWHDFFSKRYNIVGRVTDILDTISPVESAPSSSL